MLHKKIVEEPKQSQTIWYNEEKDKYYLLNNETGEMRRVHKTGDFIKEFDASLTGSVDYNQRILRANNNRAYMPYQTTSLKYNKNITYYTPQNDKFVGYTQFPNPRCLPYFNERHSKHNIEDLKQKVKHLERSYVPKNELNSTLFKYKNNNDIGVSFLTSTINDKKKLIQTGKVTVLKERQMNENLSNSMPNTVKIINNKKLPFPNEKLFSTQMIKVQKNVDLKHEQKLKEMEEIEKKAKFDLKINTERFTRKSQSIENKTKLFQTMDPTTEKKINEFYKTEATRFFNLEEMSKKIDGINSKTFDGSMKMDFDWDTMPIQQEYEHVQIRTEKMMDEKIKRQREELEGFKLPPEKEKETVITKGRFNSYIPTPVDIASIERAMNRKVFPALYKEKEKEEREREEKDKKKKRLYIDPITKKNF